jgi:hypothetical protein
MVKRVTDGKDWHMLSPESKIRVNKLLEIEKQQLD